LIKGWKKNLTEDDLYAPLQEYDSTELGNQLEQVWADEESGRKNPSLFRALRRLFGFEFWICGVIYAPVELIVLLVILCLNCSNGKNVLFQLF
jgi:ATP-binding cassette subfamily C (CFTR/MRP) protein 4